MTRSSDQKPHFNQADKHSAGEREQRLIESAHAEGRETPADGSRPLSNTHGQGGKPEARAQGSLHHILHTGLPPGIAEQDAEGPGAAGRERGSPNASIRN